MRGVLSENPLMRRTQMSNSKIQWNQRILHASPQQLQFILLHHPPCTTCGCSGVKRRSPSSCFSLQDPSTAATESYSEEPRAKKTLFCEQEDLTLHGFSTISLPSLPRHLVCLLCLRVSNCVCLIPHLHLPRPFLAPRVRKIWEWI